MYLTSALVASALALRASAFLVPLEVSNAAEQAKSELAALLTKTGRTVDLDCPGCPFFGIEDTTKLQYNVETKIHLEFNVGSNQDLTINGRPIIPTNPDTPSLVAAPQIRAEDGEQTAPIPLDFAYEKLPPVTSAEEPDKTILPFRLTIVGLNMHPVTVDSLAIDILQTPDHTSVVRITNIPFEDTPGATTCDTSSNWSLCRLRAIVAARIQSIVDAARAHAHGAKGWVSGKGCKGKKFGKEGVHHKHGHGHHMGGHHHRHHRLHRLGRMMHKTLRFFVIPALLGVIGGLMASAIGMLVGQSISYLWIRFHRNGHRRHADVQVVEIVVDEDEKDALLIDGELPPPPQYEDVEANAEGVKSDEKH
ncbi:hypothetical protein A1O3_00107 [Capronia epimyces CBS 606.96]|uniref:DUF7728 domain-containing protein n=1 Tax=Capronia epimyces CBS 606.96 TaxID=1182542 RepID=W9ZAL4_9EURO|nr:uncharacterized protein A1O3_00107 [Capronia epimyces CBS 606.96]EXJ91559.1 hypothetical protein A1O3_00107 [Capronia epimyces CBS 606.96]